MVTTEETVEEKEEKKPPVFKNPEFQVYKTKVGSGGFIFRFQFIFFFAILVSEDILTQSKAENSKLHRVNKLLLCIKHGVHFSNLSVQYYVSVTMLS